MKTVKVDKSLCCFKTLAYLISTNRGKYSLIDIKSKYYVVSITDATREDLFVDIAETLVRLELRTIYLPVIQTVLADD